LTFLQDGFGGNELIFVHSSFTVEYLTNDCGIGPSFFKYCKYLQIRMKKQSKRHFLKMNAKNKDLGINRQILLCGSLRHQISHDTEFCFV
jgi:hypothetical protein